jgi:hypothetical protein
MNGQLLMRNGGYAAPSEVCRVLPDRSQSTPARQAVRTELLAMRALTRTNAAGSQPRGIGGPREEHHIGASRVVTVRTCVAPA